MPYSGPDSKAPCLFCGRLISNRGLAQYSHQEKHIREGLLCVEEHPYGRYVTTTSKGEQALARQRKEQQ